jgi:hypothetical protein
MDFKHSELVFDLPSEEYHGEKGSFSSSQLKTILQDPEIFYKKYILNEIPKESNPAFDVGTYFHCAVLEPHLLKNECIVYPGKVRSGAAWEKFKEEHSKKTIITNSDFTKAEVLIDAINNSPIAAKYLKGSSVEVSAKVFIYVIGRDVYCQLKGKVNVLTMFGWVSSDMDFTTLEEFAVKLAIKVRADSIRVGEGIISDLKSTTGNCKDEHAVKEKVASYEYDLSASLYLDIFTAATGELYHTFLWMFASKDIGNSKTWAASEKQKLVGRVKWKKAVVLLAECISNDWKFSDTLGICEPTFWNSALLNEEF